MTLKQLSGAGLAAALLISACGGDSPQVSRNADLNIDVCAAVTEADLDVIAAARRDKVVHVTPGTNRCMWAEREDGMAYFNIQIVITDRDIRASFPDPFPDQAELVEIRDLGDAGYMVVSEGSIGSIAIRKGNRVLDSGAVFLSIEPGSEGHERLWEIYRRLLD